MKVLLVHSYFLGQHPAEQKVMKPYPPLGLLYLSAYLKERGHEVEIFDGTFRTPEEFVPEVDRFQPEVVGFYANMITRRWVLSLHRQLAHRDLLTVVGGPDPGSYDADYLEEGFDVVVRGEGEVPISALLEVAGDPVSWKQIAGLSYRYEGGLVRTPDGAATHPLDEYPFPDRAAIDLQSYLDCWDHYHGRRPVSLITARGCPYQCTWCSHSVYGHTLRKRSPSNVLEELESIRRNYRATHYWYADDVFTVVYDWVFEFRDLILENPDLRLPFETISRANRLTPEMVRALADLRCFRLWVGAESGSQRLLDAMKRGVSREQVVLAVDRLRSVGIESGMFFMWGFGDERLEDIYDTVALAERCRPDIALTTVSYPIKGTKYYQSLEQGGRLGVLPVFSESSDRDIPTLGQPSPEVYRRADRWLHHRIAAARSRLDAPRRPGNWLRYRLQAEWDRWQLDRAWARDQADRSRGRSYS